MRNSLRKTILFSGIALSILGAMALGAYRMGRGTDTLSFSAPEHQTPQDFSSVKILDIATKDKEEMLYEALKQLGTGKAMAKLVQESGGGSSFDCHQQAHYIGRVGYRVQKEKVFKECDASCHSGCYHGAMESFLNERGTENLAANIDAICKLFDTRFGIFECLHGVGHGVLAYVDYDLPDGIAQCKELSDSFGQVSCIGGAFMENILTGQGLGASSKETHKTSWVNNTDPHFPCDKIDQGYEVQYQCYQMQTSWMLTLYHYDFDKVAAECLKAPVNMIPVCFKSFGRDVAGHTLRDPSRIVPLCEKVPKTQAYYDQCMSGAVNVIVDFWGPGLGGQATELCKLAPEPGKKVCYTVLAGRLRDLFSVPERRKEVCAGFEDAYQHLCGQFGAVEHSLSGQKYG